MDEDRYRVLPEVVGEGEEVVDHDSCKELEIEGDSIKLEAELNLPVEIGEQVAVLRTDNAYVINRQDNE